MRLTPRERWLGFAVTALAALYVWFTLQPDLILEPTTVNGGDTGAHVWWPAYLRDHVLPKWRLTGWAPDWYAGFPAGHFYFPLPSLLIVLLDVVLPYNVAFKLVTALGPVALPAAAYAFARGIGARWPAPPLFAVATLAYLFFTGYTIYGGNLASTLAGEFSFTIALALALGFVGALARALDRRSGPALPAALLAATAMSHIIVAVFAATGALVVWAQRRAWHNLRLAVAIGGVGALVTAVWTLPLVARLGYATDMGWTKLTAYRENLLPPDLRWAFLLAVVGFLAGVVFARRATIVLAVLVGIFALAFVVVPEGRLWNARLLPFYYLIVMFLAASGLAELANALGRVVPAVVAAFGPRPRPGPAEELAPASETVVDEAPMAPPSDDSTVVAEESAEEPRPPVIPAWAVTSAVVLLALGSAAWYTHDTRSFLPAWIRWNYSGYEAKPAYPEFREVVQTMDKLSPGRALWEPSPGIDKYGTTLALELLPHFTQGRISSMEGLYFESAATTPYHFMMVAEVAKEPSNPVRGLHYRTIADFDLGVRHMRLLGVRYFMAQSAEAKAAADAHPGLRLVAETGSPSAEPQVARWRVYEVLDSPLVEPLRHEPVVLEGVSPRDWLEPSAAWFDDPGALDRPLAAGGPGSWARAVGAEAQSVPRRPLPEVDVTDIDSGDDWVRFRVSRPGVPVLVKTSYFPNWKADGARGPWRVTPNLMVVVPTEEEVSLRYGRTPVDLAGIGLSALGLVGLGLLTRWRPAPLPARRRDLAAEEAGGDDGAEAPPPGVGGEPEDEPAPALT